MAGDADFSTDASPSLQQLLEYFVALLTSPGVLKTVSGALAQSVQTGITVANGAQIQASGGLADKKASLVTDGYDTARKAIAWALAHVVAHLLGIEVPDELFRQGALRPQDSAIGLAMANTIIGGIVGDAGELEPSDEAATRFMGMLAHLTVQSWAEGIIVEELTSFAGVLHPIEEISKLGQELINGMGLNRLARVAMRPLAQTLIATPLDWKYKRQFRPNLLSEADIVKAFLRGDYTGDEAAEELARLGYSDRRQDQLVKSNTKRLSVDDVQVLRRASVLDRDYALQNLRDEGYDATTAQYLVTAAETRRLVGIQDDSLGTIIRAYANREIDEGQFRSLLVGVVEDDDEANLHLNVAERERAFNIKHLTKSEVIECITAEVLPFAFYRDWLAREGYPPDEAAALEVLLRTQLDASVKAADAKAAIAAEKAKAAADKQAADAKKLADLEAQRALQRRGSIADLRRAVARGLIPIDRLTEVLTAQYDADTVQIIVALAESDRAAYVAQQQAAADAKKRAAARNIDLSSLEQGVLRHIITVDAYRAAVADRGFSPADVSILTATLAAKLQDQDAAAAKKAAAEQAAKVKHIDLGRLERLVRRGIRPIADYTAQLEALGYDDGSIAAMDDLLNAELVDDTAARKLRDAARQKAAAPGLTLEQFRRAVILGIRADADFQAYLVQQGYTADDQAVLVAELRRDVADAETARQLRQTKEAAAGAVDLSLSQITAAARLGIITPDAYAERLTAIGYSSDDIAIEMELLVAEIANVQAARTKATAADTANAGKGLSLADLARAVKAGTATTTDYRARAVALGFSADDADTLASTLDAEVATYARARDRRTVIVRELAARGIDLAALEASVGAGTLTADAYRAQLQTFGYGAADAQLLGALLTFTLAGGAA